MGLVMTTRLLHPEAHQARGDRYVGGAADARGVLRMFLTSDRSKTIAGIAISTRFLRLVQPTSLRSERELRSFCIPSKTGRGGGDGRSRPAEELLR